MSMSTRTSFLASAARSGSGQRASPGDRTLCPSHIKYPLFLSGFRASHPATMRPFRCNLHSVITEPGTIEDMVADATAAGYQATERLIRDWTQHGLLDYPQKRPAGKGHGSAPALYPASQRNLLLTLLYHRPGKNISSLARIPVCIWMYWGEEYVPLRQAHRALLRSLGDPQAGALRPGCRQGQQRPLPGRRPGDAQPDGQPAGDTAGTPGTARYAGRDRLQLAGRTSSAWSMPSAPSSTRAPRKSGGPSATRPRRSPPRRWS